MNNSKRRHDGGAYRRMQTMVAAHAKAGKDRSKARMKPPKRRAAQRHPGQAASQERSATT